VPWLGLASIEISDASVSPRPQTERLGLGLGFDTEGLDLGLGSKHLGLVGSMLEYATSVQPQF